MARVVAIITSHGQRGRRSLHRPGIYSVPTIGHLTYAGLTQVGVHCGGTKKPVPRSDRGLVAAGWTYLGTSGGPGEHVTKAAVDVADGLRGAVHAGLQILDAFLFGTER